MEKDSKVTENIVVILGSLAIFAFVTIAVIALVYNRAISLKASESSMELQTKIEHASGGEKAASLVSQGGSDVKR